MDAEMKTVRRRFTVAVILVAVAAALLFGGVATYAWFTSNHTVNTSRAEARTAVEELALLVSSTGGTGFVGAEVCDITQVNEANAEFLLPVSTADLNVFFTAGAYNSDGFPTSYTEVEGEKSYYHGRIWLKAEARGVPVGSRLALYLDERQEAGGLLVQKSEESSLLLNAARLGLALEDSAPVIFYLSDAHNPESERQNNTILNGTLQQEGIVLSGSGSSVTAVSDPSVPIAARAISDGDVFGQPLAYLEFDRIYQLDIYFYMEGCDPDCWDPVSIHAADLHLAFYGVLN